MQLLTQRLILREFEEGDWVHTQVYESNPLVVRYQTNDVLNEQQSREYLRGSIATAREEPRRTFDLAVTLREAGTLIGRAGLQRADVEPREAALWFVGNPTHWGKGYITEAATALLRFGFEELGLHRVFGDCDPRNPASARVMEKLGMRKEAHFVENAFIKGQWCDSLIFALLQREWRSRASLPT